MKKRAGKGKRQTDSERDRSWFENKVAELKAQLEVLPADRQLELGQNLEPKARARHDLSSPTPSKKTAPTVLRRRP